MVQAVHPTRIAAGLDPRLSAATIERLRAAPRLRRRIAERVIMPVRARGDGSQDSIDTDLAELGTRMLPHDPLRLARMAGATWHARTIKLIVAGKSVASLVEAIGDEAYAFGLKHIDLAVAPGLDRGPSEAVSRIVETDGLRCLGSVLDRLSPDMRTRILLRLPSRTAAEDGHGKTDATGAIAILTRIVDQIERQPVPEESADAA